MRIVHVEVLRHELVGGRIRAVVTGGGSVWVGDVAAGDVNERLHVTRTRQA